MQFHLIEFLKYIFVYLELLMDLSAAKGSSNKTIFGLLIITLAIINLLISPPDKTDAFKVLKCCKLNSSKSFSVISF